MYAIFRALGKQFRAEKGQVLRLPRMHFLRFPKRAVHATR